MFQARHESMLTEHDIWYQFATTHSSALNYELCVVQSLMIVSQICEQLESIWSCIHPSEAEDVIHRYALAFLRARRSIIEKYASTSPDPAALLSLLVHVDLKKLAARANWAKSNQRVLACGNAAIVRAQILQYVVD
jgi:hypothetical protein